MASLTTDADFSPLGSVVIVFQIKVLLQVRAMTFDAATICILKMACPE